MALKRVIPCLDVDAGRVVKGTNFVDIRDAGDPVELAERYDAEGADELDLPRHNGIAPRARHDHRARSSHRRQRLHPVHDRRRHPLGRGCAGGARRRRRQGGRELVGPGSARADLGAGGGLRRAMCRHRDRRQEAQPRHEPLRRLRQRRAHAGRGPRGGGLGTGGDRARSGGGDADEHGSRRHHRRLRPRADAGGRRRRGGAGDRFRRGRRARAPGRRCDRGRGRGGARGFDLPLREVHRG